MSHGKSGELTKEWVRYVYPAMNGHGETVAGADLGFSESGAKPSSVSLKQGI